MSFKSFADSTANIGKGKSADTSKAAPAVDAQAGKPEDKQAPAPAKK